MSDEAKQTARSIFLEQHIAALATLHAGEPAVSMVPFAAAGGALVVHVSRLSTHTSDMLAHPRVSVLVVAGEGAVMPQATPRVTIDAEAEQVDPSSADGGATRDAYLARFPDAAPMFELADFSLFALRPIRARVIGGFGRAWTLSGDDAAAVIG